MADERDDVIARMEALLAEKEKKDTAVGKVMKNGGGAAAGGYVGWTLGTAAAVALAPVTGGLSVLIPFAGAIVGGKVGHDMAKDVD